MLRQASAVERIGQVRIFGRFSRPAGETAGMAGLAAHSTTDPRSLKSRNSREGHPGGVPLRRGSGRVLFSISCIRMSNPQPGPSGFPQAHLLDKTVS